MMFFTLFLCVITFPSLYVIIFAFANNDVSQFDCFDHKGETANQKIELTVVIPTNGTSTELSECLSHLHVERHNIMEVVVVSQNHKHEINAVIKEYQSQFKSFVWLHSDEENKVKAVRLALQKITNEWVLMLDADTWIEPGAIKYLTSLISQYDVVYGLISSRPTQKTYLLNQVVNTEKMMSHGTWRWGRYYGKIGPNLPGPCYLIRTSILSSFYTKNLGYLDDVALTSELISQDKKIGFIPSLIGQEHGRLSWSGFLSQRVRFSLGVMTILKRVKELKRNKLRAVIYISFHFWLYYLFDIFSLISVLISLIIGSIDACLCFVGIHVFINLLAIITSKRNINIILKKHQAYREMTLLTLLFLPIIKMIGFIGAFLIFYSSKKNNEIYKR